MPQPTPAELTAILGQLRSDSAERDELVAQLFELVYDDLKRIASGLMRGERADHSLQPTELVHESYFRLFHQTDVEWESRAHFYGIAAQAMRRILVDHARSRNAAKRSGRWEKITLHDEMLAGEAPAGELDVLKLDDALRKLFALDERMGRVAELRIFGGLTMAQVAHVLGFSKRTVDYDWKTARPWLMRELA